MRSSWLTIALLCCAAGGYAQTEVKLTADDGAPGDRFGYAVSIDSDTILVGAAADDDGGDASGSAYVFTRSGATWSQQAKLTAADPAELAAFGASVSVSGNSAVIGAYGDDDAGWASGSAYVFTRSGATWSQQAKLTADDIAQFTWFGSAVSMDGETVVVGAPWDDDGLGNSGSAYVFTRTGEVWTQQAKLTADDPYWNVYRFGHSVSLSGDTAVVGAYLAGPSSRGSVYVFTRTGDVWSQQAELIGTDSAGLDQFGWSVAIRGDTALVGADQQCAGFPYPVGSAYVFTRSGAAWSQQAKLVAADPAYEARFGYSVAISGDTAVVGADLDDHGGIEESGSAYVFTRAGGAWDQREKLTASDAVMYGRFGQSVSVSEDTAVIGAPGDDGSWLNGAAYVFTGPPIPVELQRFTVE